MAQTGQDFTLYAGDVYKIEVKIEDDNGFPAPLSGATAYWAFGVSGSSPISSKSSADPTQIEIDDVNSKVFIYINDQDTSFSLTKPTVCQHSLKIATSDGLVETTMVGTVSITPTPTSNIP